MKKANARKLLTFDAQLHLKSSLGFQMQVHRFDPRHRWKPFAACDLFPVVILIICSCQGENLQQLHSLNQRLSILYCLNIGSPIEKLGKRWDISLTRAAVFHPSSMFLRSFFLYPATDDFFSRIHYQSPKHGAYCFAMISPLSNYFIFISFLVHTHTYELPVRVKILVSIIPAM